jgi:hypothetical protein
VNHDVYVSGGGAADLKPEQFYPVLMRVRINPDLTFVADKLANMPVSRASHAMVALTPNLLYVTGGCNTTGFLASAFEYNIASNAWREVASLNERKTGLTLCPCKGQAIYAFGGLLGTAGPASSLIECLSVSGLTAKTWTVLALKSGKELWSPIVQAGAFALSETNILIFGGIINNAPTQLCFSLNPKTQTLQAHAPLKEPDTFAGSQACFGGGNMHIAGCLHRNLHAYETTPQAWKIKLKLMWDPTALDFKSDTF